MRLKIGRTTVLLLLVGLVMPAGMLFGVVTSPSPVTPNQPPAVTSGNANWAYTEQASTLLNQMQKLARKTRKEVARLQVQEIQLSWQAQSARLSEAKADVDKMGSDLARLDEMKSGLEPWQQTIVNRITPRVREMAYQLDSAIKQMNASESATVLAMGEYPQNINMIYKNANAMYNTIGTVSQYAHAEQKMAALEAHKTMNNS